MLRANQAVRLGLRAASRNPELSFGKALLDALGGALAAAAISWTLGMAFWSGALPVLAADAELQRRPPSGHFWPLAIRGFPRVAAAGALAYGILFAFALALGVAALAGAVSTLARPTPGAFALLALIGCFAMAGGILLEALARLMLVRAAAFGDGPLAAFARASEVVGRRIGACVAVQLAFLLLQLVVASA